jgi:hypothetical protein
MIFFELKLIEPGSGFDLTKTGACVSFSPPLGGIILAQLLKNIEIKRPKNTISFVDDFTEQNNE